MMTHTRMMRLLSVGIILQTAALGCGSGLDLSQTSPERLIQLQEKADTLQGIMSPTPYKDAPQKRGWIKRVFCKTDIERKQWDEWKKYDAKQANNLLNNDFSETEAREMLAKDIDLLKYKIMDLVRIEDSADGVGGTFILPSVLTVLGELKRTSEMGRHRCNWLVYMRHHSAKDQNFGRFLSTIDKIQKVQQIIRDYEENKQFPKHWKIIVNGSDREIFSDQLRKFTHKEEEVFNTGEENTPFKQRNEELSKCMRLQILLHIDNLDRKGVQLPDGMSDFWNWNGDDNIIKMYLKMEQDHWNNAVEYQKLGDTVNADEFFKAAELSRKVVFDKLNERLDHQLAYDGYTRACELKEIRELKQRLKKQCPHDHEIFRTEPKMRAQEDDCWDCSEFVEARKHRQLLIAKLRLVSNEEAKDDGNLSDNGNSSGTDNGRSRSPSPMGGSRSTTPKTEPSSV